ncbi:probable thiopurine S-methyltransferase isoform X2 [Carcharodon carcharias]|uniref:probable thiopurine S-methyltransferase isoform X2 n=1 Tax=Carcharodon carcharias TaxID=13397 RepID=UPI001B7E9665|nr:probable thiopurine S-methyltransferase isoform X2 [Carcharodon carcharias]
MSAGVAIPEGKRLNKYGDLENIELTVEDWMTRWEKKHIGFHKGEIHEFADQGHTVVGVEASKMAIKEFFAEQNLSHTQESVPGMPGSEVFKSSDGRISLFNCNVFDFSSAIAGKFDGIWDRGSLVAINPPDRKHYVKLMTTLMAKECHYLLDTFTYDQDRCAGPPFSIPKLTIEDLYGQSCNIQLIESSDALTDRQRLWGLDSFIEQIYQITLKTDTDPSALTH